MNTFDAPGVTARRIARSGSGGIAGARPAEPRSFQSEAEPQRSARRPVALVVAASEPERAETADVLRRSGFVAVFAANGLEAVTKACEDPFDLILIQASLPVLDGLEATRRIRRLERRRGAPRAHLVLVSEEGADDDRALSFEAGADGQMTKPITPRLITTAGQQALRRRPHAALM